MILRLVKHSIIWILLHYLIEYSKKTVQPKDDRCKGEIRSLVAQWRINSGKNDTFMGNNYYQDHRINLIEFSSSFDGGGSWIIFIDHMVPLTLNALLFLIHI